MVASPVCQAYATFTDAEGETSTVLIHESFPDETTLVEAMALTREITSLMAGMSQAVLTLTTVVLTYFESLQRPVEGTDRTDIEDKAYLVFRSEEDGTLYTCSIPAPVPDAFLADRETVNPGSSPAANLIAVITTRACTRSAAGTLRYIRGYARRARTRRVQHPGISTEIGG